jgi:cell division septal protein FtsQ
MTRKQARRKKQKKAPRFSLPRIRLAHIVTPMVAVAAVVATYFASASMLDRPILSIEINGPFQRVSALQIEEAISDCVLP